MKTLLVLIAMVTPFQARANNPVLAKMICLSAAVNSKDVGHGDEDTFCSDVTDEKQAECLTITLASKKDPSKEKAICADPNKRVMEMCTEGVLQGENVTRKNTDELHKNAETYCANVTEAQAVCIGIVFPMREFKAGDEQNKFCAQYAPAKYADDDNACQEKLGNLDDLMKKFNPAVSSDLATLQSELTQIQQTLKNSDTSPTAAPADSAPKQ